MLATIIEAFYVWRRVQDFCRELQDAELPNFESRVETLYETQKEILLELIKEGGYESSTLELFIEEPDLSLDKFLELING